MFLVALAEQFPDKVILGVEIRDKLVDFLGEKIRSLRNEHTHQKVPKMAQAH